MIVRETSGAHFRVVASNDPDLAHVWLGVPVKRTAAGFVPKAKARQQLVRRAGCVIVAQVVVAAPRTGAVA